jgi:general secretion pathway protein G
MKRFLRRARRGLTLVELAIVLLVLGVILGIVAYSLRDAADVISTTKVMKVTKVQAIQLPLEMDKFREAGGEINPGDELTVLTQQIPGSSFKPLPEDMVVDPWNRPYFICQGEDGSDRICSRGEDNQDGGEGKDADFQLEDRNTWPDWLKKR